jgi:hypothetical protein
MKRIQIAATAVVIASILASPLSMFAAESKKTDEAKKPYPLNTCLVSDEKFGGDMGDPYVFKHEGREIKLCCKSCLKDFKKDTAKFMKKLDEADKKAGAKKS